MIYQVPEIVRDVRIAIDENSTNKQLIIDEDIDTLSLNDIIKSKIAEAAKRVIINSPVHLLDGGKLFGDAIYWKEDYSGWIILPDDFMRLIVFKMSDWERPVYEPITPADPRYKLQASRHRGLRGTVQKPIVAIVSRANGNVLEFYSCKDNEAFAEQALYMSFPRVDRYGGIEIPQNCYRSVVYEIATLTLSTLGKGDLSTIMRGLGNELLI